MSAAHTPGEWHWRKADRVLGCDARGQHYVYAKDCTVAALLASEQEADARLIAAAPDLLAALRDLAACFSDEGATREQRAVCEKRAAAARAAIAKATGGAA